MTPDDQRIAIAKSCGAKIISKKFGRSKGYKWAWNGDESTPCAHPGGGVFGWGWNAQAGIGELPDYLNDLNASHEMEKTMTADQWRQYLPTLHEICGRCVQHQLSATAKQRAEAFLTVMGLRKEGK